MRQKIRAGRAAIAILKRIRRNCYVERNTVLKDASPFTPEVQRLDELVKANKKDQKRHEGRIEVLKWEIEDLKDPVEDLPF